MLKFVVPGGRAAVRAKRRHRMSVTYASTLGCTTWGWRNSKEKELRSPGSSVGVKSTLPITGVVAERIAASAILVRWQTGWHTSCVMTMLLGSQVSKPT